MNKIYDGGPAFPAHSDIIGHTEGMTLRDYFAGQALAGLCANNDGLIPICHYPDKMSQLAYAAADAMLAVRKQSEQGGTEREP